MPCGSLTFPDPYWCLNGGSRKPTAYGIPHMEASNFRSSSLIAYTQTLTELSHDPDSAYATLKSDVELQKAFFCASAYHQHCTSRACSICPLAP